MRVDPVLVVASAAVLGSIWVVAPVALATAAICLAIVLRGLVSERVFVVAAICVSLAAVRASIAVPAFERQLTAARDALGAPRRCAGKATVVTSPARRGDALGYVAHLDALDCEGRLAPGMLARLHGGPVDLARGDRIEIVAQLAPVELFRNAELPDPTPRAARSGAVLSGATLAVRVVERSRGPAAWIDRARAHVRARIDATFAPEAAPLARALVLGEGDLSPEDDVAFRASGLSHLLAVSGTHLVFAVLGIVRALAFVLVRIESLAARGDVGRWSAALGAVLAPVYADFAGGSGSAWRAAWMLSVGLGARALGRRSSASRSFALSLAAGSIVDPLIGFDVSFLLSAAATAGLLSLGEPLTALLVPEGAGVFRRSLVTSTVATLSAMVPCTPLLATLGPSVTLAGIAANVIAVPFGEIVSLPLCLAHALAFYSPLERGMALVASGALLVVRWLAHASAGVSWLAVPVPPPGAWHFVVLGLAGIGATLSGAKSWYDTEPSTSDAGASRRRRRLLVVAATALVLVEAAAIRAGHPRGVLRVTVLDVGQGDSTLVDLPDGKLLLVDGGGFVGSPVDPGASVILPLLRARRRSRVDVAVLSHPHPDHFLGLASALPRLDVGELWDTGQGREQGAGAEYAALIAGLRARGVPIRGPESLCGPERSFGGARLSVLLPCPAFEPGLGANDNSFVVRIGFGHRGVLLMGDAEHDEEEKLLRDRPNGLQADLLKTGHHGSRTSTSPALLAAVRPSVATLSCGVRNRFGHPHPETLATLARAGVPALRTDLLGSAEWSTNGQGTRLRVFGETFRDRLRAELW